MSELTRPRAGTPSAGDCPDDELLLAFLTSAVDPATAARLDVHVDACDACLAALLNAQHRLSRDVEMAEPVPAAVLDRLAAVPPQRAAMSAGGRDVAPPAKSRVRRLPISPLLRYAAPLALAASLLLFLVSPAPWFAPSPPERTTRGVALSQKLRVTAHQAPVRVQPHLQADVLSTLRRGDVVEVGGEDREWYRVFVPGGGEGWVEQDAFR